MMTLTVAGREVQSCGSSHEFVPTMRNAKTISTYHLWEGQADTLDTSLSDRDWRAT